MRRTDRQARPRVEIVDRGGHLEEFDAVVIATHPHQALAMLAEPTPAERELLGSIRYTRNDTVLHTDVRQLPTSINARASWNYRMAGCSGAADRVQVSYDMSRLQRLASSDRVTTETEALIRMLQPLKEPGEPPRFLSDQDGHSLKASFYQIASIMAIRNGGYAISKPKIAKIKINSTKEGYN